MSSISYLVRSIATFDLNRIHFDFRPFIVIDLSMLSHPDVDMHLMYQSIVGSFVRGASPKNDNFCKSFSILDQPNFLAGCYFGQVKVDDVAVCSSVAGCSDAEMPIFLPNNLSSELKAWIAFAAHESSEDSVSVIFELGSAFAHFLNARLIPYDMFGFEVGGYQLERLCA